MFGWLFFFVIFSKMTYFYGKNRKENYLFLAYDNRYICTRVYAKHRSRGVIFKRIVRSFFMRKWKRILFFLLIIQFINLSMNSLDAQAENSETHKVQKGETSWRIAKSYGITIAELKEWNDMESDTVYADQIIKVKNPTLTAKELPKTGSVILENQMEYIVQPGETLWRIATRNKMTVDEIKSWNQLSSDKIKDGQILKIKKQVGIPPVVKNKVIALTFDDGPSASVTPRVLDILKKQDVKATFFVTGQSAKANPELIRREISEGHEIGNHTLSHPKLTSLSIEEAQYQVSATNEIIQNIANYQIKLLRPPYGLIDDKLIAVYQMPIIEWSVDTEDWKSKNADMIYEEVMRSSTSGAIVLMHDIHPTTADALETTIISLKKQGYSFVSISDLYGGVLSGEKQYYQASDVR